MRISQPVRKRPLVSLTSLIDVIFLLLLFFMLTSVFLRFSAIEMAGTAEAGAGAGSGGILLRLEGDGVVRVNGQEMEMAALDEELARLAGLGARHVTLQAGENADMQELVSVTGIVKASPITRMTLKN